MNQERQFKRYVLIAFTSTKEYIEKHPLDGKTTIQFAIDAKVNRKQLQAAFKTFTGMGLQEFLSAQRMKQAGLLLREGNLPIKEIALTCRYKSQRAFTTAFKKAYGVTPLEYQKKHSLYLP